MERADEGRNCSECGAELAEFRSADDLDTCDRGVCSVCCATPHANERNSSSSSGATAAHRAGHASPPALEVLPPVRDDGPPPLVKLIRELKMPTVERLVVDPNLSEMPAAIASVERALDDGDLPAADRLLDSALGTMLEGPGHVKQGVGWGFLPVVLWLWCVILLFLLLLSYLA